MPRNTKFYLDDQRKNAGGLDAEDVTSGGVQAAPYERMTKGALVPFGEKNSTKLGEGQDRYQLARQRGRL